jgi:lipoyl(octanoyl) transferase
MQSRPFMQQVFYKDLGLMPYREAWDLQTGLHLALVQEKTARRPQEPGTYPQAHQLLLVEHPHVYTLGKSGTIDHLLLSENELQARGIEYFPINRGGDITYHGPGQIVGYPLLDLECFFTDVHRFVRSIEEVIIRVLAEYGLEGSRISGYTGVWLEKKPLSGATVSESDHLKKRKICAIGVHLSRWVSLHGWAFNVNTQLEYFNYIVPCGIVDPDKTVTSMAAELGRAVDLQHVKTQINKHFADVFQCEMVD